MRPIKYKAFIKKAGVVVDVESIHFVEKIICHENLRQNSLTDLEPVAETDPWITSTFDDIKLLQFTGLHDKNGKEIYEGYVVKFVCKEDEGDGWYSKDKGVGRMEFDTDWGWRLHIKGGTQRVADALMRNYMEIEVIGTIYENPELLK